jgi:anti-anti-sigma factor
MTTHDVDEVVVLKPQSDLCEGDECDEMERMLEQLARQGRPVIVDLRETRFLTAHALGVLAQAARSASAHGGRIALCGAARLERWLLELTGLTGTMAVCANEEIALQHLRAVRAVA